VNIFGIKGEARLTAKKQPGRYAVDAAAQSASVSRIF